MSDVTMPQLGETVADGTVTKWFKAVGDQIEKGEALFEVATDKVDTEIPAPATGVLTAILVAAGLTVDVGTILATIDGVATTSDGPTAPTSPTAPTPSETPSAAPVKSVAASAVALKADGRLSPVVRRLLGELNLRADQVTGTGPNGRIKRTDVLSFAPSGVQVGALSPVVRRLLEERGLQASQIIGTGANGRLTRKDVEAFNPKSSSPPLNSAFVPSALSGDEVIPFTKIRKLTAEHMTLSKAISAHTLMAKEIDYEAVERVRRVAGGAFKQEEGFSLTFLAFNAAATLEALREFPLLNASVGDNELIVHHNLNLGIAVDLDSEGLVVPVMKNADQLSLREIARSIRELATRARGKKLSIDSFNGGTFTITNPGPFGTFITGAVINQPQVAILSTDGVQRKPVVVSAADGSESIAIHSVGILALTFDHRAVDGAYAAQFLVRIAEIIATRDWLSEL